MSAVEPLAAAGWLDDQGRPLRLGRELARGGEGSIHLVEGNSALAAKLYHRPVQAVTLAKLQAMIACRWTNQILSVAALPTGLITTAQGQPCGLLMPLIIDHLGSEQLTLAPCRRRSFPYADWHFLAHVAKNLSAAVEVVHAQGLIIGDLNDGSYLIKRGQGTVALVDADSFQLTTPLGVYRCEVGKPLYTAPELHHVDLSTTVRTVDHDHFALAILIFQLLFLGRHPFAGRPLTSQEITPERAVEELRFAYGRDATRRGIERPPHIIGLDALPASLAALFEAAFAPTGRQPGNRPSASTWQVALDQLLQSMRVCPDNRAHKFTATLAACPWCRIENASHAVLFACLVHGWTPSGQRSVDIQTLLTQIETVQVPTLMSVPLETPVRVTATGFTEDFVLQQRTLRRWYLAAGIGVGIASVFLPLRVEFLLAMVLLGVMTLFRPRHLAQQARECQQAVEKANEEVALLRLRWEIEASGANDHKRNQELVGLVREWRGLDAAKLLTPALIETRARAEQLTTHLSACLLQTADIPGISIGRKAIMISYGISSAEEVEPNQLMQVPGLDADQATSLKAWRATCEKRFVFDASYSRQAIRDTILEEVQHRRDAIAKRLIAGQAELQNSAEDTRKQREVLQGEWRQAQTSRAQALCDQAAIVRLCRFPFLPA